MKVSMEWLKDYVDLNLSAEELAHKLTMAGIPVENIEQIENDHILELELTPNRGDCLGMMNVAREISAVTGLPLHFPQAVVEETDEDVNDCIKVSIADPDLCRRYSARVIKNIRIAPSPAWLQSRLEKAGVRPINNVVDVTNYVMLETNQPLHAFDYDLVRGQEIIVRRAQAGELLHTLDESERMFDGEMLVIADTEGAVGLAGIMGGANSEINNRTTNVLLESANFHPGSIRKTARKLGMRTDASVRFEKGVDVQGTVKAINRAARLIELLGAGEVLSGVIDVYPGEYQERHVTLRPDRVNYVLGTELSFNEIKCYLQRLQFPMERVGQDLQVTVPSYRPDLSIEEDLIEEVARLYGYDNIPSTTGFTETTQGLLNPYQSFQERLLELAAKTMRQVVTYSFINPRWLDVLLVPADSPVRDVLTLVNPLSEEQGIMRPTILPGLLDTAARNISRQMEDVAIFEMANVFKPKAGQLPDETMTMTALVCGRSPAGWQGGAREMDFYYLKGIVEDILQALHVPNVEFSAMAPAYAYHPGRCAEIKSAGKTIGIIGELHPMVLEKAGLKKRAAAMEINVDILFEIAPQRIKVSDISRYPTVYRDLAFVVPEEIQAHDLVKTMKAIGSDLLSSVHLFDVYRSAQLGDQMKSLAFALSFQSNEGTLQDELINRMIEQIVAAAADKHSARLR